MEEKKRQDRRVTRTKQALHQALAELVQEKGYAAVTVEEITTRANLGRTTFYLHYQDKESILLEGLEDHLSDLVNDIVRHPLSYWFGENKGNFIRSIFEKFKENSDVFKIILNEQSDKVYNHILDITNRVILKLTEENPWLQKKIHTLPISVDFVIVYFSGAMWSSIIWWAKNDFAQSTDEMTKSFTTLFIPSLLGMLKVENLSEIEGANKK